jgi:hypothetical protein
LESKGADTVNFDEFRTLKGSQATGSTGRGRLTNLMHLNVDTSWFIRNRSATNPDFDATFPQALTITNHTAIPIADADLCDPNHIQVIANIAAFHFGYIEQGGSSLYPALGRKVSSLEVLKITQGIGGEEIAHFLEWADFCRQWSATYCRSSNEPANLSQRSAARTVGGARNRADHTAPRESLQAAHARWSGAAPILLAALIVLALGYFLFHKGRRGRN